MKSVQMKDLFAVDPQRFTKMHLQLEDLIFDYSKNIIESETLQKLFALAEETKVKEAREQMFSGMPINQTENRSVLHTALRNFSGKSVQCNGEDVMPGILKVQAQM